MTPEQYHYLQIGKGNKKHCDNRKKIGFVYSECPECKPEKLLKEVRKLQRELNSPRLSTYMLGDTSDTEMNRRKERESKLARFNEVLKVLNEVKK